MLKARMDGGKDHKLSAGQHLLASASSGASSLSLPCRVCLETLLTQRSGPCAQA